MGKPYVLAYISLFLLKIYYVIISLFHLALTDPYATRTSITEMDSNSIFLGAEESKQIPSSGVNLTLNFYILIFVNMFVVIILCKN